MRWIKRVLPYLLTVLILSAGYGATALLEHIPSREENVQTETKLHLCSDPLYIAESETLTLYPWDSYDAEKNLPLSLSIQQSQKVNLQIRQTLQYLTPYAVPENGAFDPAGHLEYDATKQYLFLNEYQYDAENGAYLLTLAIDVADTELLYYTCFPVLETRLEVAEKERGMEQLQKMIQEAKSAYKILYDSYGAEIQTEIENPLITFFLWYSNMYADYYASNSSYIYNEIYIPWVFFDFSVHIQTVSYNNMLLVIGTDVSGRQLIVFYEPRTAAFSGLSIGE